MRKEGSLKTKGYVQLYTGCGKGKTTAALGLALRASGHGIKTYIGQFMKGGGYGEEAAITKLKPYVTLESFGKRGFVHVREKPDEEDIRLAKTGLERIKEVILSGEYGIVVLDEVTTAIFFGLLSKEDVLEVIREKPENVELILTGRYAPQELIDASDLVTEMKEIKHYYTKGILARPGIEY